MEPIQRFLAAIPPFDRLPEAALIETASALDVIYAETGQRLAVPGDTPELVWLPMKGQVEEIRDEEAIRVFGPEEPFGALGLLRGSYRSTFRVAEELVAYTLPAERFHALCREHPAFQAHFHDDLATKLESLMARERQQDLSAVMLARIDQAYLHPPVWVDPEATAQEAAQSMEAEGSAGALVGRPADGAEPGLVTVSSLYRAVVARGLPATTPVGELARHGLVALPRDASLFDAMLAMTRHGISRVAVREEAPDGTICGFLEQSSLMSYYANHSHLVVTEIRRAASVADLARASTRLLDMVASLSARGVRTRHIQRLVSALDRQLFARLFELVVPEALAGDCCLVLLGSEGRGEQILKTDQDNLLLLRPGTDRAAAERAADALGAGMERMGYPPCPGGYMTTNPRWRLTPAELAERIGEAGRHPEGPALMDLAVLLDGTPAAGDPELWEQVRSGALARLDNHPSLLSTFARPALDFQTPLGPFSHLRTGAGATGDALDVKKGGIFPVVHGARSLALEARREVTGTLERLRGAVADGILNEETVRELTEALDFLTGLRLRAMLAERKAGRPPEGLIRPAELSRLERDLLKDAFQAVKGFKRLLAHHFHLNLVT
ncbi:putative nucleotidyltransferase substrate binding domain-containing protein [Thiohalorhabdus methylotrophus]|uniref:Nucleotidyltransferase substrate binding domain-containing protein n=1 Tax=Thiohalorhabdus methylotrophus TaxID=3242694 RepID=A0ABV4TXX9_9GAMM